MLGVNLDFHMDGEEPLQLERPSRIAVLSVLLFCCAFGAGCGKRPLTEKVVVGTYKAEADWGESILILPKTTPSNRRWRGMIIRRRPLKEPGNWARTMERTPRVE
jgi:hypothetical protein